MINKFGILGYFPFRFLSQHFTFLTIKAHIGRSCNAQFQLWFDSFHPLTGSHCGEVFVCFPRKLSSRVKRAARKGPLHPPIQAKAGRVLNETKVQKFKRYQLGVDLCDKRIIPRHIKSRLNIHFRVDQEKKEANFHFAFCNNQMVKGDNRCCYVYPLWFLRPCPKLDIMMCKNGLIFAGFCVTHRKCRFR